MVRERNRAGMTEEVCNRNTSTNSCYASSNLFFFLNAIFSFFDLFVTGKF